MLVVAWGLGLWLGIRPLSHFKVGVTPVFLGLVATVPMILGLVWILRTNWGPARQLVSLVTDQLGRLLAGRSRLELALLALLAGLAEEVLFRGVIQVGLTRAISPPWALLATSVLFGLAHFASVAYAVLAAVIGVYLGALFLLQNNLLIPVMAHALYDFVALMALDSRYGRHQRDQ